MSISFPDGIDAEVTATETVERLHIVYKNEVGNRNAIYEALDIKYGFSGWRSIRSGPIQNSSDGKGLLIIELRL